MSMSDKVSQTEERTHSQSVQLEVKDRRSLPSRSPLASWKVAVRLGLAFSVFGVLLIVIGDLGLRRMDRINADLLDIMDRQWTTVQLSLEAVAYSSSNSRITMQVFLLKDKDKDKEQIGSLLAARAENTKKISALLAELEGLCDSEEDRRLLAAVRNTRGPYIDSYLRALHFLLDEKNHDAATAVMVQQTTPALLNYHAAWDEFVRFQGDELELAVRQSRARYAASRHLALFIMAIAVLLAGAIALLVIKRTVGDMTTRFLDEQETLREAERRYRDIFDEAIVGMFRSTPDGRLLSVNPAMARICGFDSPEEMIASITDISRQFYVGSKGGEEFLLVIGKLGSVKNFEYEVFRKDGSKIWITMNARTVRQNGVVVSYEGMIEDITESKLLRGQLLQAQKLESIGQLAAGIAHEINTPTQYIGDNVRFLKDAFQDLKGLLENYGRLLLAAKANALTPETVQEVSAAVERADLGYLLEETPKAIEQTLEGVGRVSKLVSAMKDFSHPDTKDKVALDLNRAIESTITVARNEWKYVADVETDYDSSLPMLACLPGEFNQVVLNLIVNAAHAIAGVVGKKGPEKGTIKVQTRSCPEWCEIRIQDTGTGIPEAARTRVFDPFFTTKEIGKGTGQGLAIARSVVVDKHGGTIHFETEEGKGTTFIIRLPYGDQALSATAASS